MPRPSKQPAAAEAIPNAPPFDEAASRAAWLEAERRQHADVVYLFVGPGQGVPGLPHRLTLAEAERLQMTATLKAGLENRNYTRATAPPSTGAPVKPISNSELDPRDLKPDRAGQQKAEG